MTLSFITARPTVAPTRLAPQMVIRDDSADRDDARYFKSLRRMIRRAGEVRLDDPVPGSIRLARELEAEVAVMWATLVARWRESGWTDAEIGNALGLDRRTVGWRWPQDEDFIYLPR